MVTYVFLQIETVKAVNLSFKDVAFRETQKTVKLAGSAQLGEGRLIQRLYFWNLQWRGFCVGRFWGLPIVVGYEIVSFIEHAENSVSDLSILSLKIKI